MTEVVIAMPIDANAVRTISGSDAVFPPFNHSCNTTSPTSEFFTTPNSLCILVNIFQALQQYESVFLTGEGLSFPPITMEVTLHMDSSIWSKTPEDIILLIIEVSDRASQINWSFTCRMFYNYTCPRIWSHLTISSSDIDGYAGNPELWWWPGGIERNGKIHLMAKYARRESRIARMSSCIQSLFVDVRGDQPHTFCNEPAASQLSLEIAIRTLLPLLPNLTTCIFDGALYRETLDQLVQVSNMKCLELRADDCYLEQGRSYLDESQSWVWRRWSDLVLDFSVLANLKSLQCLKIGRLQHHEARGLAEGVAKLRLVKLEIHSSPWVSGQDPQQNLAGGQMNESPLMFFFDCLARHCSPSLSPNALPSTLETLILRDRFRGFTKPTKQTYLCAACRNCQSLRRIESTYPTCQQACGFFSVFGWRPIEERFGNSNLAGLEVPGKPLEETYNGIAELQHLPSPCLWEFACARVTDDVLERAGGYNDGNGKFSTEFRTIILERLDEVLDE